MRIDVDENKKRAKLFSENEIYGFVFEKLPNGLERTYNGFIVKVHDDFFDFFDVVKRLKISVILGSCIIENSNGQIIPEEEAREIYKRWKDGRT